MPSSSSSSKNKKACHEEDMVDRLAKIEYDNPYCADCPTSCPRWVSFLRDCHNEEEEEQDKKKKQLNVEGILCVVICDDCAIQHHKVLSKERCMIKCLECIHEWTHEEVDTVLGSGNEVTNRLYEASLMLTKTFIVNEGMIDNFIRQKYKKHKFRDHKLLEEFLRVLEKKGIHKAKKRLLEPESTTKSSSSRRKTWTAGNSTNSSSRTSSSSSSSSRKKDRVSRSPDDPRSTKKEETSRESLQRSSRRESAPALIRPQNVDSSYKNRRVSRSSRISSRQRVSRAFDRMTSLSSSSSTTNNNKASISCRSSSCGTAETASVSTDRGLIIDDYEDYDCSEESNSQREGGGRGRRCSSSSGTSKTVSWADASFLVDDSDNNDNRQPSSSGGGPPLRRVQTDPDLMTWEEGNNSLPILEAAAMTSRRDLLDRASSWSNLQFDVSDDLYSHEEEEEEDDEYHKKFSTRKSRRSTSSSLRVPASSSSSRRQAPHAA